MPGLSERARTAGSPSFRCPRTSRMLSSSGSPYWTPFVIRTPSLILGRQAAAPVVDGEMVDSDLMVDTVVSELASVAGIVVLVIDDLQELRSADALSELGHLLNVLPESASVVLSSRRDPPIRLHRLRLADEVAELRAGDLRFTASETRELLAASEITLSESGAAALYERTEGWAAGLRLAVISLRGHPDPELFVDEFSGTDRAIGEYLMAEMFERQPNEVQSMLLRTSVADRLNGELADLLAGRPGCEQMLLALEDANAFVVSLDAQRRWFRYHQLLADFLGLELRRTLAEKVPDLHRKAAGWFLDHGEVVKSIRHTLAAGDWPDAARLLADHLFSLTLDGQEGSIAALLRSFPAGASAEHPELALAHAATQLAQGRLEEASAQLALAEVPPTERIARPPPTPGDNKCVPEVGARPAQRPLRGSSRASESARHFDRRWVGRPDRDGHRVARCGADEPGDRRNLVWPLRRCRAARDGRSDARPDHRPTLHRGRLSGVSSVSVNARLAREARELGRQSLALGENYGLGDRPVLAPASGRGCQHKGMDGRVRGGRALAPPRLGRRPGRH